MKARSLIPSAAIAFLLCLPSCCTKESTFSVSDFDVMEDVGLWQNGKRSYEFKENSTQFGMNGSSHQYRTSDDNMTEFVVVTCKEEPVEGAVVKGDVVWTTRFDVKTLSAASLLVRKIDASSGKIWFWSEKDGIGIIAMHLAL